VSVNGQPAGKLPLAKPLRVPAGSVALEVRAPGYLPVLRTVLVPARGLAREPVTFVAATAALPETEPRPEPRRAVTPPDEHPAPAPSGGLGARRIGGIVLLAAGVVGLGGGVAFHLARESTAGQFNDSKCGAANGMVTGPDPGHCQTIYNDIQANTRYAIAGYAAGVALGGVGLVLLLTGGGDAHPPATSTAHLACGPELGLGVTCVGRF